MIRRIKQLIIKEDHSIMDLNEKYSDKHFRKKTMDDKKSKTNNKYNLNVFK